MPTHDTLMNENETFLKLLEAFETYDVPAGKDILLCLSRAEKERLGGELQRHVARKYRYSFMTKACGVFLADCVFHDRFHVAHGV